MDTIMSTGSIAPHDDLPTPPTSTATPSHHPSPLPKQRRHALKPGSPKEGELIRYLDHGVGRIQKRCDDRFKNRKTYTGRAGQGVADAYRNFAEAAKDMNGIIDVIWVSGSPNLQIPYLLNMAVMISEFLPLFRPAPRATFRLLDKMDVAFSSLLQGKDYDTGESLPGFEDGHRITTTHKVRLKGIVERTRLVTVRVMSGDNEGEDGEPMETDEDVADSEETDEEGYVKFEGFEHEEEVDEEEWEEGMIGKVYERTIGELGDVLGGPPIGIITEG